MASRIEEMKAPNVMCFKHLSEVKNSQVQPVTDAPWSGGLECYRLTDSGNGTTQLVVEVDMVQEFREYFENTFPKALNKVKEISEK